PPARRHARRTPGHSSARHGVRRRSTRGDRGLRSWRTPFPVKVGDSGLAVGPEDGPHAGADGEGGGRGGGVGEIDTAHKVADGGGGLAAPVVHWACLWPGVSSRLTPWDWRRGPGGGRGGGTGAGGPAGGRGGAGAAGAAPAPPRVAAAPRAAPGPRPPRSQPGI